MRSRETSGAGEFMGKPEKKARRRDGRRPVILPRANARPPWASTLEGRDRVATDPAMTLFRNALGVETTAGSDVRAGHS